MSVNPQTTALITTFRDRKQADRFVGELKRAGFQDEEIGLIAPHKDGLGPVEEGTMVGALGGGAVGAVAGAAATGLIPGVGPVIAAGLLTGVLGGAFAGATTGGVLGALVGLGVPEDEAEKRHEEFLDGRTLVVVQALGRGGEAVGILDRCREESDEREAAKSEQLAQAV
jgi:hypothetical protein